MLVIGFGLLLLMPLISASLLIRACKIYRGAVAIKGSQVKIKEDIDIQSKALQETHDNIDELEKWYFLNYGKHYLRDIELVNYQDFSKLSSKKLNYIQYKYFQNISMFLLCV